MRRVSKTAKTGAERVAAYRARQREAGRKLAYVSSSNNDPTETTDLEGQLAKIAACLRELEVKCQRFRNELERYRIELARYGNGGTVTLAPGGAAIRQAREERDQRIRDLLITIPRWSIVKIAREVGSTSKVVRRVQKDLAAAPTSL